MKINDIIALTNAGWSKQEIMKMAGIESNPTPAGTPQPVNMSVINPPAGTPEPVKMPTVTLLTGNPPPVNMPTVNQPTGTPQPAEENETLSLLRNLTQMMQRNNINNMQNPTPEQPDAAELLAKILD
nr:MAG TPA: hypothetical protein [Caudoviricetes sp.]